MKKITASTFRIILSAASVGLAALIVGVFMFGYGQLKAVGEETSKHKADAVASEDAITDLQRLKVEIENRSAAIERLETLRVNDSLPQFSTERSLRTIAGQLGLGVKNISFVSAPESGGSTTPATTSTPASETQSTDAREEAGAEGSATPAAPATTPFWGGSRNSAISFEFSNEISYEELIRFLHAIENSTPKLRLDGISIPSDSTRQSINPGVLTLEIATI